MVPAKVNVRRTELLFDSGAAFTGINRRFAEYFGIKIDPIHKMRIIAAYDEPVDAPISVAEEICVGGVMRKNLPVLIIAFPPESELHGLIGMNFLQGLRFTVETDSGVLILRELKRS
jgi:predicted aspartyl protease